MRKLMSVLVALALAAITLGPSTAAAATSATITLRVAPEGFVVPSHWTVGNEAVWVVDPAQTQDFNGQDGIAGCTLHVSDANGDDKIDGGEVLDTATADGCIAGWDYTTDEEFGRFVTAVDNLEQVGWPVSWWLIQIDGFAASSGIDDMDLQDGQSLEFVYYLGT